VNKWSETSANIIADHLQDYVGCSANTEQTKSLRVARHPQRAVPDETSAQQWSDVEVGKAVR